MGSPDQSTYTAKFLNFSKFYSYNSFSTWGNYGIPLLISWLMLVCFDNLDEIDFNISFLLIYLCNFKYFKYFLKMIA